MAKTITETKEFLVGGEEMTATYSVEDLRGMKAFEADITVESILDKDNDPINEEDYSWVEENIIEQVRFHQFCKCIKNSDNECGHDKYLSLLNDTA
jgi:hypothetical protein